MRAEEARAENPERDAGPGAGRRLDRLPGLCVGEVVLQFDDILRKAVGTHRVAAERADRELVGTGRASETQVDAPRMKRLESPELLGDHDRRVVREHDPTGADADRARPARYVRDHHRRRCARNPDRVVMLGEPEAAVAPTLDVLRKVERVE